MKHFGSIACLMLLLTSCSGDSDGPPSPGSAGLGPYSAAELTEVVKATRGKFDLPGLGVLIQVGDEGPSIGVAGVRRLGSAEAITPSDMWFIGSAAKSMTATLLATYVQEGSVSFETTLVELFPEYSNLFNAETKRITLEQLLNHTSGLRPNPADSQEQFAFLLGDAAGAGEQRQRVLKKVIADDLLFSPGSDSAYSNTAYILVGAAIERVGAKEYETLLAERVFTPLGIENFGFGHPGSRNGAAALDQPWGHRPSVSGLEPVAPDDGEQVNPPVFNSAGNLYLSLQDWAVFVRDQLRGRQDQGALLSRALYERLHLPPGGESGFSPGWGVLMEKGVTLMLTHNGSDGSWFADVRAYPPTNLILLVVTNDGREDDEAKAAAAEIRRSFQDRYSAFQ